MSVICIIGFLGLISVYFKDCVSDSICTRNYEWFCCPDVVEDFRNVSSEMEV